MSRTIDHDNRIRTILKTSLALFPQYGFDDLNYRQIAAHCGLSRTTIYQYFPNKRALFDATLNFFVAEMAVEFRRNVEKHPELSPAGKIELVMRQAIEMLCTNGRLLQMVHAYLLALRHCGESVARRVMRHTIVIRRTLIQLSRDAVNCGEFRTLKAERVADILYAILESTAQRVAISESADKESILANCRLAIDVFKN